MTEISISPADVGIKALYGDAMVIPRRRQQKAPT